MHFCLFPLQSQHALRGWRACRAWPGSPTGTALAVLLTGMGSRGAARRGVACTSRAGTRAGRVAGCCVERGGRGRVRVSRPDPPARPRVCGRGIAFFGRVPTRADLPRLQAGRPPGLRLLTAQSRPAGRTDKHPIRRKGNNANAAARSERKVASLALPLPRGPHRDWPEERCSAGACRTHRPRGAAAGGELEEDQDEVKDSPTASVGMQSGTE